MSSPGSTMNGRSLHRVRIVLVEPTHPGNVGAAARAMKAMGLDRLCLVAPRRFPSAEATARAAGADDVLHAARIVESLDEALSDCGFVLGTTARSRRIEWPVIDVHEGARRAVGQAARTPVAVVFGRESAGLTNAELDRCHALVRIPAAAHFSSLNVAAAVQILAYEIRIAALGAGARGERVELHGEGTGTQGESVGGRPVPQSPAATAGAPATAGELEGFYRHLEAALIEIGYLDPAAPKLLMRRLRRLFNRAIPDRAEINILRGILSAATRRPAGASDRPRSEGDTPGGGSDHPRSGRVAGDHPAPGDLDAPGGGSDHPRSGAGTDGGASG